MKQLYFLLLAILLLTGSFYGNAQKKAAKEEYYQLRIYQYRSAGQEQQLEAYLQHALLPAVHRAKISAAGVFKALANDTAMVKKIYVVMPLKTIVQWEQLEDKIYADKQYQAAAASYLDAPNKQGVYDRVETLVLKIFPGAHTFRLPKMNSAKTDRIYELRSYESSTERQHRNKVEMFIAGGETVIFDRLGMSPVFYGRVIAGSKMPNLVYMTVHANMEARNQNWQNFGKDTAWQTLKKDPRYQNNVSHIDITYLKATSYSDF
jgi:hypothetical protein